MKDEELLKQFDKLIKRIARQVRSLCPWAGYDDLQQLGREALLRARAKCDPAREFAPYACVVIRRAMLSSPDVRRGLKSSEVHLVNKARTELFKDGKERPTVEELAARAGVAVCIVELVVQIEACARCESFEDFERVAAESTPFEPAQWSKALLATYDRLLDACEMSENKRTIARCVFFPEDDHHRGKSTDALAAALNLKADNVRQLRGRAHETIRRVLCRQLEVVDSLGAFEPLWTTLTWIWADNASGVHRSALCDRDTIEAVLEQAHARSRRGVRAGTSPDWLADLIGLVLIVVQKETVHD